MRKLITYSFLLLVSCQAEVTPKPKAFLDLNYPATTYKRLHLSRPYSFFVSEKATVLDKKDNWLSIQYPRLKATVDITYRPVKGNLIKLIQESEKLVFKHTVKAEKIASNNYEDTQKKVYGSLYEITGNAASQIQFHLTDSIHHFIKGALYFNAKPNYDSVLPAVAYIRKDIRKLIETLEWTDQ